MYEREDFILKNTCICVLVLKKKLSQKQICFDFIVSAMTPPRLQLQKWKINSWSAVMMVLNSDKKRQRQEET